MPQWESGSEFHWGCLPGIQSHANPWSTSHHVLGGSGRDVLRLIINYGMRARGWKRIWVPSYLCQKVVTSIVTTGIQCILYPDIPRIGMCSNVARLPVSHGDALLVVNHFGIRKQTNYSDLRDQNVDIVEDHTHDPWSTWAKKSTASYCLASLRKTLPVPDGGVLWSATGCQLPDHPPVTNNRESASLQKIAAMSLKQQYLIGNLPNKDILLSLFRESEDHSTDGDISGATNIASELIASFAVDNWRRRRKENLELLISLLSSTESIALWDLSLLPAGQTALSLVLTTDSPDSREKLRVGLVERQIYPAVLWPLKNSVVNGVRQEDIAFSETSLSIHIDGRYQESDIHRIAKTIRSLCTEKQRI